MAAGSYTVVTVTDHVRLAIDMRGTDAWLTDAEINGFIYENITATRGDFSFQLVTSATTGPSGVYKCFHGYSYGLYLWGPTMSVEADCIYVLNSKGAITVTSGTPTATAITVTGAVVDFSAVMVQLLHWLATHRSKEISASAGGGSINSQGIHAQLLEMADYWTGIRQIA